jgi:hypothetical protein
MILRMTILIPLHLQSLWMRNRIKIGVTALGYRGIAMKELNMSIENDKPSPYLLLYIQTKVYSSMCLEEAKHWNSRKDRVP